MVFEIISREIAKVWQIGLFPPGGNTTISQALKEIRQLSGPCGYVQKER